MLTYIKMKPLERVKYVVPNAVLWIALDQWTKYLATVNLRGMPEITFLDGFVRLLYVTNRGAWGSLGSNWPEPARKAVLIVIPILFILFLSVYLFRAKSIIRKYELVGFSFILAGGVGNMIDRIHADAVIDMLWMGHSKYWFLQTNVFNIADVAIMIGFFMMVIDYIRNLINSLNKDDSKDIS